jgi:glycosyltransferase involved in cell wall biosynthesis
MTADAVGGVWTYALELADALAPMGVEVHLAVLGPEPTPARLAEVAESAVASCEVRPFALEWMPQPWSDVDASGQWLLELAERLRPDVVHLNGYALAVLDWPAPTVVVAHSDVASWWRAVHGGPPPAEWDEYRARVAAGLRAANAVVAPTAAVLADLARDYGVSGGLVVYNGRRSDWVVPVPKEPLALAAGRAWDEAKNLAALDRIAPSLQWPVAIAGEGPAAGRYIGPLAFDELKRWLLRAAVFVAPALYEPFGLAILEAAHAGCALVLADRPSLREVWDDAAVYVPPRDDAALRSALNHLIDDPRRLGELAARARRRAGCYTPDRTARGYVDVYSHLAAAVPS